MSLEDRPILRTQFPRPESKLGDLQGAVGKTIVGVEFGEEEVEEDCHQAEAIILHFSDGKSLSITVGSNVMHADAEDPSDFETDLMVHWLNPETSGHPNQQR